MTQQEAQEGEVWKHIDDKYEINNKGIVRTIKLHKPRKIYYYISVEKLAVFIDSDKYFIENLISKYFYPVKEVIHNKEELENYLYNKNHNKTYYNALINTLDEKMYIVRSVRSHFSEIFDQTLTADIEKQLDYKHLQYHNTKVELEQSKRSDTKVEPDVEYIPVKD